jgi:hypothetical protein
MSRVRWLVTTQFQFQLKARVLLLPINRCVHSHWHSYAETMDDEPDVMNDVALRSVVR